MSTDVDKMSDAIVGLINSSPRSPSRSEIAETLRPLLTPRFLFKDGGRRENERVVGDARIDAAFCVFDQVDGASMAYYERQEANGGNTVRYVYDACRWRSRSLDKIVARIESLATELKSLGAREIVWRYRPELIEHVGGEWWTFYCRLHTLPYFAVPGAKREGEMVEEV